MKIFQLKMQSRIMVIIRMETKIILTIKIAVFKIKIITMVINNKLVLQLIIIIIKK
jgi:hypothetical protein